MGAFYIHFANNTGISTSTSVNVLSTSSIAACHQGYQLL